MESGNDGAAGVGLFVWLKSMANVIVEAVGAVAGDGTAAGENASAAGAGDNCASAYQILPSSPAGEKTKTTTTMMNGHQKSPDRNNNNNSPLKPNGSAVKSPPVHQQAANGKVANGFQRLRDSEEEDDANSSSSLSFNEEGESTHHHHRHHRKQSKHIPEATTKLLSDENSENDDDVTSTLPCCDIMKKKHQLCGSLRRSSPTATENGGVGGGNLQTESNPSVTSSSTTKIPFNKIIEAIIEVIKKGELIRQFDPLVETKTANFHISPLGKFDFFICLCFSLLISISISISISTHPSHHPPPAHHQ